MTTSPSQNAEGNQVWKPSVGIYFNPAKKQRESYGGIVGALQDQIASQNGVNKAYPHNFAGIIAAIEDLVYTQKEVPVSPDVKPPGGDVGTDSEGNPQWDVSSQPRNGELWFDTRQGRLFIAIDNEYYQTNGADGLATVTTTTTEPTAPSIGSFWWDVTTKALYIFDGFWRSPGGTIVGTWVEGYTPVWRLITTTSTTFAESAVAIPSGSVILREPSGSTLPALNHTDVTNQSQFNAWIYNSLESLETAIEASEGANAKLEAGTTAPSNPGARDLWYDTGANKLKIYSNSAWIEASPQLNYDSDFTNVTALISSEQTSRQAVVSTLTNQIAAVVTDISDLQNLEANVESLETQVNAIPIVDSSLLTPLTTTAALDTRVSTLESATPDFSVVESATNAASNLATVNARIDALPTVSQLDAVSTSIPSVTGLASEAYVDTQVNSITSNFLPRTGGRLTGGIVLNKSDVSVAGLDFTTAATDSQNALKFVANDGFDNNHITTYGTTDDYWEYAYKFNEKEDFCWIHNNNKVASINKDGIACNQLFLADFQANTLDGRVINNPINIRAKISDYDTELSTIRSQIATLNSALGVTSSRIFYGDNQPTETVHDGDIWFDSRNLRMNVQHDGYWIFPDRVEDLSLKSSLFNAVNTSPDFETLKIKLLAVLD